MVIVALLLPATIRAQESPSSPVPPETSTNSQPAESSGASVTVTEIPAGDRVGNLFANGDFSDGKSAWKGSGTVVEIDGHKALEVKLRSSSPVTITTNLKVPSDTAYIQFYFQIQADDSMKSKAAEPIRAYFWQGRLITYIDVALAPGEKKYAGFRYQVFPGTHSLPLQIEIRPGTGTIYLSNFVASAKQAK